jgi:hypothetical protein
MKKLDKTLLQKTKHKQKEKKEKKNFLGRHRVQKDVEKMERMKPPEVQTQLLTTQQKTSTKITCKI